MPGDKRLTPAGFPDFIRAEIERRGMNQTQLAELAEVDVSTISKYLSRDRGTTVRKDAIATMVKIAAALDLPTEHLKPPESSDGDSWQIRLRNAIDTFPWGDTPFDVYAEIVRELETLAFKNADTYVSAVMWHNTIRKGLSARSGKEIPSTLADDQDGDGPSIEKREHDRSTMAAKAGAKPKAKRRDR